MKPKTKKKFLHIVARSIELRDAAGKPRIFMDAGNGDGHATICVFSNNNRAISISTTPEGSLHISLEGTKSFAAFNMTAEENAQLSIRDKHGSLGTELGASFISDEHNLTIFRKGQIYWTTRKRTAKQSKKTQT